MQKIKYKNKMNSFDKVASFPSFSISRSCPRRGRGAFVWSSVLAVSATFSTIVSVCTGIVECGVPEVEAPADTLPSLQLEGKTVYDTPASPISKKHCYISGQVT